MSFLASGREDGRWVTSFRLRPGRRALWLLTGTCMLVWFLSGLYSVGSNQTGVVLRFGRVVERAGPGLHWAIPWPVDRVLRPTTTEVKRIEVGFRFLGKMAQSMSDARRSDMLTGDENILKLMMVVQYKVRDPAVYLFGTQQPDWLVERTVESAMSAALAWRRVDDVLTSAKEAIQVEAIDRAQKLLSSYGAGITLLGGNLQIVSPPEPVVAAFNDVTAARKDSEKMIEDAHLYANQVIPEARGQAQESISKAQGVAELRVDQARGEADRFQNLLVEFRRDPEVTRNRLYLETMEQVLSQTSLVVVHDRSHITILQDQPTSK